jgi:E3 ubiquitin-protein ligase TRIP12
VLLEAGIVDTLYQILTGVLPSSRSESDEQGNAPGGQGLGGGLADMTVMQNLAHRPKDQVEEALSLIAELLPPLPKGMLCSNFSAPISSYLLIEMACMTIRHTLRNLLGE